MVYVRKNGKPALQVSSVGFLYVKSYKIRVDENYIREITHTSKKDKRD